MLFLSFAVSFADSQWQQVLNYSAYLGASGNNILAGTPNNGMFISTNNGANWQPTSLSTANIYCITGKDNYAYAGAASGIYLSTNNGFNWSSVYTSYPVYGFAFLPGKVFAGTTAGVIVSTNNGLNWAATPLTQTIYSLLAEGGNLFAGTQTNGVYISTNQGANWTQTSLNNRTILSLAFNGTNIFAGTDAYGVYTTSNNGTNWSQTALDLAVVTSLQASTNSVIASTYHSGIYTTTNNGANWIQKNEGFTSSQIKSMFISGNLVFCGNIQLSGASVYRRSLNELVGIQQTSSGVPESFLLSQNYPNPFNPVTNIEFSVPKSSNVKLAVYDMTGRELEVLVNQNLSVGTYKADWDASKYSSGIYFYTISAENFYETKRMVLVK